MGRNADQYPSSGKRTECVQLTLEPAEALPALRWVRTEDFLIRDTTAAGTCERADDCAGVAGIGDGRDPRGPACSQALSRRCRELFGRSLCLAAAESPDPSGEISVGRPLRQAGKLQVSMCVDQAGDDDRVPE